MPPTIMRMPMSRKPSQKRKVKCENCGKPFFTRHSQAKWCPGKCRAIAERKCWRDYGRKNKEKRNQYHRKLYRADPEKVIRRIGEYRKTKRGKEMVKRKDARMRKKFPEKYSARQEVLKALKRGELKKEPCNRCGSKKVHAHHTDYSKPLKVIWLCEKHHREAHDE